jgi:hypothetical protein
MSAESILKPFFPKVQLTVADAEIWDYWLAYRKPRTRSALLSTSLASDSRDGELMLRLMKLRQHRRGVGHFFLFSSVAHSLMAGGWLAR